MAELENEGLRKHAQAFFQTEAGKKVKRAFVTSEGYVFLEKKHAAAHATTTDNVVESFDNTNEIEVEDSKVVLSSEELELLENGLVKSNYQALKKLVAKLNLVVKSQQAEELIKALENYKNQ